MKSLRLPLVLLALFQVLSGRAGDLQLLARQPVAGDFVLVANQKAAPLLIEKSAPATVLRAANDLVSDIERVSAAKPALQSELSGDSSSRSLVIVGVIGHSAILDQLASAKKLNLEDVRDQWESFVVQTIDAPLPGVDRALVIAGSDHRGAIYGIYALSEAIGLSPWYWWADVPVKKQSSLAIRAGIHKQAPPAVKYRGIFINDEDWGLQPWAAKTFEPETKDIGPKTYAKIFELLLRLGANTCWPGMHPSTHAFNFYPGNKQVADDYGIVMGSSHAEPMLRNNVDEWPHDRAAAYNYVTNRDEVLAYWEQRAKENGKFENLFTMGMRGVHDSGMPGGGTLDEKAERLTRIIADQRELLKKWVNPDPAQIPQIFCPYKEVLELYHRMKSPLPGDITLVWPDDNWSYVRQFSDERERQRPGGAGVYYHISYWGAPYDYLWLCSTPPALIWEEMTKAYDYGARNVWIVNVGDIKPAEIGLEFFIKLAWNPRRWTAENAQHDFLQEMAARDFSPELAPEITEVLQRYYQLGFARKPEHMGLDLKKALLAKPAFSLTENSREAQLRILSFAFLKERAEQLRLKIPEAQRDAFYELVLYPVRGANAMNRKGVELGRYYAEHEAGNEEAANVALRDARAAHETIQSETRYYNEQLAGGKWRYIMSAAPRKLPVFDFPQIADQSGAGRAMQAASDLRPKEEELKKAEAPALPERNADFVESLNRIVLEAEHASARFPGSEARWETLNGVGYNGASVLVTPTTAASKDTPEKIRSEAPRLEYKVWLEKAGDVKAIVRTLPTWAIVPGRPQRYAIAIDDAAPQLVSLPTYTEETNPTWQRDVLRNAAVTSSTHPVASAGAHTLKLWMVDPGVVFDTLMLEREGAPDAGYMWPYETRSKH